MILPTVDDNLYQEERSEKSVVYLVVGEGSKKLNLEKIILSG